MSKGIVSTSATTDLLLRTDIKCGGADVSMSVPAHISSAPLSRKNAVIVAVKTLLADSVMTYPNRSQSPMANRKNILICGAASTGKATPANGLAKLMPDH
jgi:hypothetical protein